MISLDGQVDPAQAHVGEAETIVSLGHVRRQFDRSLVFGIGLVEIAQADKNVAELEMNRGLVRIERNRGLKLATGRTQTPQNTIHFA